jgi:hypothetical protein
VHVCILVLGPHMQPVQGLVAPRRSSRSFLCLFLRQVHQEESTQTVQKADCEANNDNDCIDNVCAEKKDSSAGLKCEVRESPVHALRRYVPVLLASVHYVGSPHSSC